MNNNCTHQFERVGEDLEDGDGFIATFVCLYCGQVREVDDLGNIEVTKQYGDVKFTDKNPQS